jgi:hypothetical protein
MIKMIAGKISEDMIKKVHQRPLVWKKGFGLTLIISP